MLDRSSWNISFQLVLIATLSVLAGLWLRFDAPIPPYLRDASGGISYVVVFILFFGAVSQKATSAAITVCVLVATCCLEFLQLWHPVWLEACRRTIPGRLLLGTTFEWADFPPYFVGAGVAWMVLRILRKS
ncbi:MAG: DUF2809 domain-containing protein [Bryobacteraceae bacterium]